MGIGGRCFAAAPTGADSEILKALCGESGRCMSGAIERNSDPGSPNYPVTVRAVYRGRFSSPDADEALVDIDGVGPHASNFGGYALLRRRAGRWEVIDTGLDGLMNQGCQVIPGPPPLDDTLLCGDLYRMMGDSDWKLSQVSVDGDRLQVRTLIVFSDISARSPGTMVHECGWGRSTVDQNDDGRLDVVVNVQMWRARTAEHDDGHSDETGAEVFAVVPIGHRSDAEVVFENTGPTLRPTAASRKVLRRLEKLGCSSSEEEPHYPSTLR
jgi:hypothetical protein